MNNIADRPAPASPPLLQTRANGIATLTLDRPTTRNPLSEAMLDALSAAFADLAVDPAARAVVLAANGPVFCAGHDLKELTARRSDTDGGRAYFTHIMARCASVMQAIINLPKPVIAAVEGTATAAGCMLVATCDLAIAGERAQFCTPGVKIGLFCSTPMVALSRNLSRKHAMEMLLMGEMVGAEAASRLGLVNRAVAGGAALAAATEWARTIAEKSTLTVSTGKKAFYAQLEMGLADAYAYASQVMVDNMLAHDAQEGIGAFIDKRRPRWDDR